MSTRKRKLIGVLSIAAIIIGGIQIFLSLSGRGPNEVSAPATAAGCR